MKQIAVTISPSLSTEGVEQINLDKNLEYKDFRDKNGQYELSIIFGGKEVNYGLCSLFDYYADVCQEIYALEKGRNHDMEMSGYPVAHVTIMGSDTAEVLIYGADENGTPVEFVETFSLDNFIDELKNIKKIIERYVTV